MTGHGNHGGTQDGHPFADACYHRRHDQGHGVCWDGPHRQAAAIRKAVGLAPEGRGGEGA